MTFDCSKVIKKICLSPHYISLRLITCLVIATILIFSLRMFLEGLYQVSVNINLQAKYDNIFSSPAYKSMPWLELSFLRIPEGNLINNQCIGVNFVIFVYSKPDDFLYRRTVRNTWGQNDVMDNLRSIIIFPLGLTKNITTQNNIEEESWQQDDIIQGNFTDTYQNLTYKGILILKFFTTFCKQANHLVKMDSDIFPNIFNLDKYFKNRAWNNGFVSCKMYWRSLVLRPDVWCGKWCIPERDYKQSHYPPYCSGSFYTISGDLVPHLYHLSSVEPLWWVADVHITGHLLIKLKNARRVILSNFMESDIDMLLNKLDQVPDSVICGYINGIYDIYRAWRILQLKYNNSIFTEGTDTNHENIRILT